MNGLRSEKQDYEQEWVERVYHSTLLNSGGMHIDSGVSVGL